MSAANVATAIAIGLGTSILDDALFGGPSPRQTAERARKRALEEGAIRALGQAAAIDPTYALYNAVRISENEVEQLDRLLPEAYKRRLTSVEKKTIAYRARGRRYRDAGRTTQAIAQGWKTPPTSTSEHPRSGGP